MDFLKALADEAAAAAEAAAAKAAEEEATAEEEEMRHKDRELAGYARIPSGFSNLAGPSNMHGGRF